jgi:hypothetical protein
LTFSRKYSTIMLDLDKEKNDYKKKCNIHKMV